MIRYALTCDQGHDFEAWFGSIGSYDEQVEARAVICPCCGSAAVHKAPMAPPSGRGRLGRPRPLLTARAGGPMLSSKTSRRISRPMPSMSAPPSPEEARKMHYGESEARSIYGEATIDEAKALKEEGIPALPLPPLPEDQN
jgi:hypothetical protein